MTEGRRQTNSVPVNLKTQCGGVRYRYGTSSASVIDSAGCLLIDRYRYRSEVLAVYVSKPKSALTVVEIALAASGSANGNRICHWQWAFRVIAFEYTASGTPSQAVWHWQAHCQW